jgi:large subunit ribosomal protein L4
MATPTFTKAGTKATTAAKLDKHIFDIDVTNHELLKQAYLAHLANRRDAAAKTKKRGEVRGGGIKPWAQKGTGRARVGSIRSPIWRGGGITFGPTGDQNYTHSLTTGAKRQAVRQALSLASSSDKIIVLESLNDKITKTSEIAKFLDKVGVTGTTLLVVDKKDEMLVRVTRNLSSVKVSQATYLNVFDVLNADHIVITTDALKSVSTWLTKADKAIAMPATAKEAR